MMRSASSSASSTSLVTSTTVFFSSRQMASISSCSLARVSASSADSGSSSSRNSGFIASARATATRWRMPPESSAGRRSVACDRPTMRTYFSVRSRRCALLSFANTASTASATFSNTVSHGISE